MALLIIRNVVTVAHLTLIVPLSVMSGKAYDQGDVGRHEFLAGVLYCINASYCLMLCTAYGLFGRQMVRIAEETSKNISSVICSDIKSHASTIPATANDRPKEANRDADMKRAITKVYNFAFPSPFESTQQFDACLDANIQSDVHINFLLAGRRSCLLWSEA